MKLLILLIPSILWASSPATRLSQAIQFKTISETLESTRFHSEFKKYHIFLKQNYPLTFSKLEVVPINLSFLLIWKGESSTAPTALFNAHQDVVPVEDKDLANWDQPPFSGFIDNQYIWGRGTMDDKVGVQALLETIESQLKKGFQPEGTLYFALTHDEELGGWNGASQITQYLKEQKHRVDFVYDEGLIILKDVLKDFPKPVALIGIGEKGYLTLKLSVFKEGGHSSMPDEQTAITILNRALARLSNPIFKRKLIPPMVNFFKQLGEETTGLQGFVLRHPEVFSSLLISQLSHSPASDALLQTTRAITVVNAGVKENKIPNTAEALINFRILHGDTIESIQKLVRKKVKNSKVKIEIAGPLNAVNPSPLASRKTEGYDRIKKAIKEVHTETLVASNIMVARTDSYHYQELTPNIYRFLPLVIEKKDTSRIHGINERISIENYRTVLEFYKKLIQKF